ncbi:MAG: hypothetical protein IJO46_03585, partial [Thermoguttaceae bacterium]|nr:hypothetical protein [Thermoguttaceae bacterium]
HSLLFFFSAAQHFAPSFLCSSFSPSALYIRRSFLVFLLLEHMKRPLTYFVNGLELFVNEAPFGHEDASLHQPRSGGFIPFSIPTVRSHCPAVRGKGG